VQVTAVAYDNPIPGFKTRNCINLRLWAAKPSREFDLEAFNTGDYVQVCARLGAVHGSMSRQHVMAASTTNGSVAAS
jgi:glucan phosphorylase